MEKDPIKDAQYRKGLSIAFFNATNAAIEIVKLEEHKDEESRFKKLIFWRDRLLEEHKDEESRFKKLIFWRDRLLEEHKVYYANVIDRVGLNYNVQDTLKKLAKATDLLKLKNLWQSLSEDERNDPEIFKFAQELKKKYEKAQ